jgi:hypothetical protein
VGIKVGYPSDIFSQVTDLNISVQYHDQTMVVLSEKITAFMGKLKLWTQKIKGGEMASFQTQTVLLEDFTFINKQDIIVNHMESSSEFMLCSREWVQIHLGVKPI